MRKPPENLDAWGAYQRGLWHHGRADAEDNARAQQFFQQAIDLDPNFSDAYCGLVFAQSHQATQFQTRTLADASNSAERLARLAVALDSSNAVAHSTLSYALLGRGDFDGALTEADRALALSPNLASGYWARGRTLIFSGRPQEGLRDVQTSLRLDPGGPDTALRLLHMTIGFYYSHAYRDAVEAAKNAIRSFPSFPLPYRWLAAALGQCDRIDEANEALEKAIEISPASFDMYVRARVRFMRREDPRICSKACARPGGVSDGWHPPTRRDPCRRCGGVFAADGGG
jgi:adenylate cyclase